MFKFVVLAAALACANAGLIGAPLTYAAAPGLAYSTAVTPAVTSQSANILRSFGNLGQVSTYHKTVDTPFSSVSKSDVRVSNPGIQTLAATSPYAYAAAPAIAARAGLLGVAYSAAPAVAHITYESPVAHYAW